MEDQDTKNRYLIQNIKHNYPAGVISSIQNGANINCIIPLDFNDLRSCFQTPLTLATNLGFMEIVGILISNNVLVNQQIMGGETALIIASRNGYTKIVDLLVSTYFAFNRCDIINVDLCDDNYYTAIMYACLYGHLYIVKLILLCRPKKLTIYTKNGVNSSFNYALQSNSQNKYHIFTTLHDYVKVKEHVPEEIRQLIFLASY
jgi:ankyrin repeat protein